MVSEDLLAYYARDEERDRLARGVGRVEFARTVEIVGRTLPAPGTVIADIGGGPGRCTDWLVEAGYRVIHRDVVPDHVEQVRTRHGDAVDAAVGDACALDLPDESVDGVLLLGPLYHLDTKDARRRALGEARRILRPRGMVHAAAISRWAPRLDGMLVNRIHRQHPDAVAMVEETERSGRMRPFHAASFNGYTHTPDELRGEVTAAGLVLESLVALEGIAFALADVDERMDDAEERELLMTALRSVESVPDLVGIGPHLLAGARRSEPD